MLAEPNRGSLALGSLKHPDIYLEGNNWEGCLIGGRSGSLDETRLVVSWYLLSLSESFLGLYVLKFSVIKKQTSKLKPPHLLPPVITSALQEQSVSV